MARRIVTYEERPASDAELETLGALLVQGAARRLPEGTALTRGFRVLALAVLRDIRRAQS